MKTLDKKMIHILGMVEKGGARFHNATRNLQIVFLEFYIWYFQIEMYHEK